VAARAALQRAQRLHYNPLTETLLQTHPESYPRYQ
jgi:hypothetical protein